MKSKKVLSLLLSIGMLFSLVFPAFAADATIVTTTSNEYEYIIALKESSEEELFNMGLTRQEAAVVIAGFEDGLEARARMSDNELRALGYESGEIGILRAYAKGARLSEAELRAITGTCTGKLQNRYCSTKGASFCYMWEWDHAPIIMLADSAAIRWEAYDGMSHKIGVTKSNVTATVQYYQNNAYSYSLTPSEEPGLEFNAVNVQFLMGGTSILPDGSTVTEYAKKGSIWVTIELLTGSMNNIDAILIAGLYGHTTLGVGSPSISLSPAGGVAIGFSGNMSIDAIAGKQGEINIRSTEVIYH